MDIKGTKDIKDIKKIVITGSEHSVVSSAKDRVRDVLTEMGYTVLFVPEAESVHEYGEAYGTDLIGNTELLLGRIKAELQEEAFAEEKAKTATGEKALILCEGGMLDFIAYMTDDGYEGLLESLGESEVKLRDSYDAVFCISVDGSETEQRIISAWTGNPHVRVIDNFADFERGCERLVHEVAFFLGEPEPLEIERKYLIEYPDTSFLSSMPCCQKVEIVQTYMKNNAGENMRLRKRGCDGSYIYFLTQKKRITALKRIETERRLNETEYNELMELGRSKRSLKKDRYCLMYKNRYFEIDVYPFWHDRAIMEIELSCEDAEIALPDFIHVIKEVTGDRTYNNSTLAKVYDKACEKQA